MANHIGPAQQRQSASSHRPTKVSRRLFSETAETAQAQDTCRAIFFLLDNPELSWVPDHLCRTLTEKGYNSRLCHLRETSNSVSPWHHQAGQCEYWLVPATTTAAVDQYKFDHVVLLVPANLEAVLTAYKRIQQLARPSAPNIGVVLVGPRDRHSAWRYFRQLAVGALRDLDIPLLNLGFLPEQLSPQEAPVNHHRNNPLARIGERLLRSEFYTPYPSQTFNRDTDESARIAKTSLSQY